MAIETFVPLIEVFPNFNAALIGGEEAFKNVGFTEYEFPGGSLAGFRIYGTAAILTELNLELPWLPGLSLAFLYDDTLDLTTFGIDLSFNAANSLFFLELNELDVALRVQSSLLRKVEKDGADWVEVLGDDGEVEPMEVALTGVSMVVDSNGEFNLDWGSGSPAIAFSSFTIGQTGIVVELNSIALILNEDDTASLPGTIDSSSRGVYLDDAKVHLPSELVGILPSTLAFDDAFIGSGGFSGKVDATWAVVDPDSPFDSDSGDFFGIQFRLETIGVEFVQNSLVAGGLSGYLKLPFFEAPLLLEVTLTNDGDFSVSASSSGDLEFTIPDVMTVSVEAIEFARKDGELLVTISGELTPLIGGFDWPTFELKGLTISSTGKVSIEGGWIELPERKTLDFNGFAIEIAALGFGREEDGATEYRWIGFSGGIQIVSGLPIEGGVEGLKLLWNPSNPSDFKLQLSGVYVALEIENTLKFNGHAKWIEDTNDSGEEIKGFSGGVDLTIIPLNGMRMEAQFLAAKNLTRDFKYFYIYLGVSLPAGIPVVPPVLGLYGLKGLFGYNVTVDRSPSEEWYTGYYKRAPEGITHPDKWKDSEGALALGAGVTLRTLPDTGFALTTEVLLILLIPGPIIILEGKATLISREPGDPYPFKILVVLDAASGTFLANVELTYKFPKSSGFLLDMGGMAEVFFSFNDPTDWHLYLGQDEPESKRIRAEILSFFKASTYFMLDPTGLRLGVWVGYDLDKKYGPLRVILQAWIDGRLELSFQPVQAKGSVTLYGNVELKAFGIGLGLSAEANVSVEAPKPLVIEASVKVQIKTPLGNPSATVKLKWEKPGDPGYPLILEGAGSFHPKVTENLDLGKAVGFQADDDGIWNEGGSSADGLSWSDRGLVPPDTRIALNFGKMVKDETGMGMADFGYSGKETVGNYHYQYALTGLSLEEADSPSGSWTNVDSRIFGAWQMPDGADELGNVQLLIGATTPYERYDLLDDSQSWTYGLALRYPDHPCGEDDEPVWLCTNFQHHPQGRVLGMVHVQDGFTFTSPKPIQVLGCNDSGEPIGVWHALTTEPRDPIVTCIDIAGQTVASYAVPFSIDNVQFTPGSEWPLEIETVGPRQVLYNRDSNDPGQTPVVIEFLANHFPNAPAYVELHVNFLDNTTAEWRFYNPSGTLLATQVVNDSGGRDPHIVSHYTTDPGGIARIEEESAIMRTWELCYGDEGDLLPELKVIFPEASAECKLTFCTAPTGEVEVYDTADVLQQTLPITMDADNVMHIATAFPMAYVLIRGYALLHKVCVLTEEEKGSAVDSVTTRTKNQTLLEAYWDKTSADIFEPNKYYKLKVTTEVERKKKSASNWGSPVEYIEYVYFQTGPVPGTDSGISDSGLEPDGQAAYPTGGPLVKLDAYIWRSIPLSAGANQAQYYAYRSYDVGIQFNEAYVPQLYAMESYDLKIRLYDNNGDPLRDETGAIVDLTNLWEVHSYQVLTKGKTVYKTQMEDCIGSSTLPEGSDAETVLSEVTPLLLKPRIQYRALLVAKDGFTIHDLNTFNFITSAYVHFIHQAHSYLGAAWDNLAQQVNPGYTIHTLQLDQALTSGLEEALVFEQLFEVFGLSVSRPLPQEMEITALNDAVDTYGFLLESPEPMDVDRVGLSLLYKSIGEQLEIHDEAVRLVAAQTELSPDPNGQWVDLLFRSAWDVSGYTIETRRKAAAASDPWDLVYTFGEDVSHGEGTLVRIYGGTDPATGDTVENERLYADLGSTPFNHAHMVVRILDADGEVVHSRIFLRDSAYVPKDLNLVWNTDGTRAFLFARSAPNEWSSLGDGFYRIQLVYDRDPGGNAPMLMRHGFSGSETANLDFSLPALLPDV